MAAVVTPDVFQNIPQKELKVAGGLRGIAARMLNDTARVIAADLPAHTDLPLVLEMVDRSGICLSATRADRRLDEHVGTHTPLVLSTAIAANDRFMVRNAQTYLEQALLSLDGILKQRLPIAGERDPWDNLARCEESLLLAQRLLEIADSRSREQHAGSNVPKLSRSQISALTQDAALQSAGGDFSGPDFFRGMHRLYAPKENPDFTLNDFSAAEILVNRTPRAAYQILERFRKIGLVCAVSNGRYSWTTDAVALWELLKDTPRVRAFLYPLPVDHFAAALDALRGETTLGRQFAKLIEHFAATDSRALITAEAARLFLGAEPFRPHEFVRRGVMQPQESGYRLTLLGKQIAAALELKAGWVGEISLPHRNGAAQNFPEPEAHPTLDSARDELRRVIPNFDALERGEPAQVGRLPLLLTRIARDRTTLTAADLSAALDNIPHHVRCAHACWQTHGFLIRVAPELYVLSFRIDEVVAAGAFSVEERVRRRKPAFKLAEVQAPKSIPNAHSGNGTSNDPEKLLAEPKVACAFRLFGQLEAMSVAQYMPLAAEAAGVTVSEAVGILERLEAAGLIATVHQRTGLVGSAESRPLVRNALLTPAGAAALKSLPQTANPDKTKAAAAALLASLQQEADLQRGAPRPDLAALLT